METSSSMQCPDTSMASSPKKGPHAAGLLKKAGKLARLYIHGVPTMTGQGCSCCHGATIVGIGAKRETEDEYVRPSSASEVYSHFAKFRFLPRVA